MTVEQLIKQLEQLNPQAGCVFAEYTQEQKTVLWHLGLCCNTEHQADKEQVWFRRDLLVHNQ